MELMNSCPTSKPDQCGAATPAESFCDATTLPTTGSGACLLTVKLKPNCKIGGKDYLILYRSTAAPPGTPATLPNVIWPSPWVKLMGWPHSHATTLGTAVHPCDLKTWKATLNPGDGYYYDPLPSGKGYCKPIRSANVEGVRKEMLSASISSTKWNSHHSGATFLPTTVKLMGWPNSHQTTIGTAVHPCNLQDFIVTRLDQGDGYYYDPLASGEGFCKPIRSANVEGIRTEHASGAWTQHSRGATYLPPPQSMAPTKAPTPPPTKAPTKAPTPPTKAPT